MGLGVQTDAPFPGIAATLDNLVREVRDLQCRVFELTYARFPPPQLCGQMIPWPAHSRTAPPHQPSAPSNMNPLSLFPSHLPPSRAVSHSTTRASSPSPPHSTSSPATRRNKNAGSVGVSRTPNQPLGPSSTTKAWRCTWVGPSSRHQLLSEKQSQTTSPRRRIESYVGKAQSVIGNLTLSAHCPAWGKHKSDGEGKTIETLTLDLGCKIENTGGPIRLAIRATEKYTAMDLTITSNDFTFPVVQWEVLKKGWDQITSRALAH
ncbi:hypothetical protein PoB_006173700 [Plakobranchus ocellatus]|uniref:Uncharacterized protein n=1 Tax=Plakobranchus ocellatus TaxID=259542 RepID=A0AAV4CTK7_9GAST|nr:hypothetical protein PoB_006173700 [Plakobranchus ocellatus]